MVADVTRRLHLHGAPRETLTRIPSLVCGCNPKALLDAAALQPGAQRRSFSLAAPAVGFIVSILRTCLLRHPPTSASTLQDIEAFCAELLASAQPPSPQQLSQHQQQQYHHAAPAADAAGTAVLAKHVRFLRAVVSRLLVPAVAGTPTPSHVSGPPSPALTAAQQQAVAAQRGSHNSSSSSLDHPSLLSGSSQSSFPPGTSLRSSFPSPPVPLHLQQQSLGPAGGAAPSLDPVPPPRRGAPPRPAADVPLPDDLLAWRWGALPALEPARRSLMDTPGCSLRLPVRDAEWGPLTTPPRHLASLRC